MEIYVISLLCDIERRNELKLRFRENYNNFNIITAKDKNDAIDFISNNSNKIGYGLTLAETACSLSHINILNNICLSDSEFSLVLEDDVIGTDEDIARVMEVCAFLPQNSILIAGGQEGLKSYKNLYGILVNDKLKIYKIPKLYYRYLARTSSYLISKKIAKSIVMNQKKEIILADQWDRLLMGCDSVYFSPILRHPISLENSHIESERKLKRGKNTFIIIYREGVVYSLYFFLRKKITMGWAKIKKYHNILENSK